MKQKGFAPVLIILLIAILGIIFFFGHKNTAPVGISAPPSPSITPSLNAIIPNVIDQWVPQVSWQEQMAGNYQIGWMEKPAYGIIRKGAISDSSIVYDIDSIIDSKIKDVGWTIKLPLGASGSVKTTTTFTKTQDGAQKILVIQVEGLDDPAKTLPKYKSQVIVFQEQ